jgi:hypothetical protein
MEEETYACGHPTGGLRSRDQWKAKGDCPECWLKKQKAAEAILPIECRIRLIGFAQNELKIQINLLGGTQPVKDKIKELGYQWDFDEDARYWFKIGVLSMVNDECDKLKLLAKEVRIRTMWNAEDLLIASNLLQIRNKFIMPPRPAAMPPRDKFWNGRVYGQKKYGFKIYINNVQKDLTEDEAAEISGYHANIAAVKRVANEEMRKYIDTIESDELTIRPINFLYEER